MFVGAQILVDLIDVGDRHRKHFEPDNSFMFLVGRVREHGQV